MPESQTQGSKGINLVEFNTTLNVAVASIKSVDVTIINCTLPGVEETYSLEPHNYSGQKNMVSFGACITQKTVSSTYFDFLTSMIPFSIVASNDSYGCLIRLYVVNPADAGANYSFNISAKANYTQALVSDDFKAAIKNIINEIENGGSGTSV